MLLARRPLLFLLFLGCSVSLMVSGRFTLRLVVDGAISFAFVPAFCLAGLAVVCRLGARTARSFASVADAFFAGFTPWLVWLIVAGGVLGVVPPRAFGSWFSPLLIAGALPVIWSLRIDWRFFQDTLGRSPRQALRDLAVHRAIEWIGIVAYFLGVALWYEALPTLPMKLGLL
jgi:hypothetical protein